MNQQQLDQFLNACGMAGPLRLDVLFPGDEIVQRRTFHQPFVLVGRNVSSDLCLPDDRVSKRHAYLQMIAGRLFYFDLGSRTGVECHGVPEFQGWLHPGQALWIGPCAIRLPNSRRAALPAPTFDEANCPPNQPSPGAALTPVSVLRLLDGPTTVAPAPLQQVFTILGNVPRCSIRLADPSVSRYHCGLLHTPAGVWVIDLLGREGTRINGNRVRWARLGHGDHMQVGAFEFEIAYEPGDAKDRTSTCGKPTDYETNDIAILPTSSFPFPSNGGGWPSAGAMEAVLMPVLNQFNLMQQQMFDQFHQTMLMMVQMFSSLHHDQTRNIREQLDELRAVTRELDLLRGTLADAANPSAAGENSSDAKGSTPAPDLTFRSLMSEAPKRKAHGPDPLSARNGESVLTESSIPTPTAAPAADSHAQKREITADLHGWLTQRINALQSERQGRWQRLLSTLLGK